MEDLSLADDFLATLQPPVAWVNDHIEIIEQTKLPTDLEILELRTIAEVVDAIFRLAVRGAPAIGSCGALGMVVGLDEIKPSTTDEAHRALDELVDTIGSARPTGANLSLAVNRVQRAAKVGSDVAEVRELALREAFLIIDEDRDACTRMGLYGLEELAGVTKVMTHCNTGRLATAGWGTALGVIYAMAAAGRRVEVLATESRPLMQGSRLTAWELHDAGIDVTLAVDGASHIAMAQGKAEVVIVGADRIAANGDTANKIGTATHAINAKAAGIPFYVVSPLSTFDLSVATGDDIDIELRPADELRKWRSEATAPQDVPVWNPAFDVTPAELITAIITEVGVLKPPYRQSIRAAFQAGEVV